MSLFLAAARKWESLSDTSYDITIGHKNTSETLHIAFRPIDFHHLSGIHYAKDIEFGLYWKEYQGEKLIQVLTSQKMDSTLIEKSANWDKISERLSAIIRINEILESDFSIYRFHPRRLPFHSTIKAAYFLYREQNQDGIFLFVDQEEDCYYCKSIFQKNANDYRSNQTRWTVLKKTKRVAGTETPLFTHPSYKEQPDT